MNEILRVQTIQQIAFIFNPETNETIDNNYLFLHAIFIKKSVKFTKNVNKSTAIYDKKPTGVICFSVLTYQVVLLR